MYVRKKSRLFCFLLNYFRLNLVNYLLHESERRYFFFDFLYAAFTLHHHTFRLVVAQKIKLMFEKTFLKPKRTRSTCFHIYDLVSRDICRHGDERRKFNGVNRHALRRQSSVNAFYGP